MDARTALRVVQKKYEVQCSAACKNHRAQFRAKHGNLEGCNHLPSCPKKPAAQKMRQKGNEVFLCVRTINIIMFI